MISIGHKNSTLEIHYIRLNIPSLKLDTLNYRDYLEIGNENGNILHLALTLVCVFALNRK